MKMKLDKLERHTAYIIMLAEFENKWKYGFCPLIGNVFEIYGCNKIKHFPELLAKKPKVLHSDEVKGYVDDVWFSYDKKGMNQRKQLLKQCIEETY